MNARKRVVFRGSAYSDSINQSVTSNGITRKIFSLGGDDSIDLSYYPNPRLSIYAGTGNDRYSNASGAYGYPRSDSTLAPRVYGQSGDDILTDSGGGTGLISGGTGNDRILYHSNTGATSFQRGRVAVLGGSGNDVISYWTAQNVNSIVRGGEGDDLIGIDTHVSGYRARQQLFYGDGGNDTFYVEKPPVEKITRLYGGSGFDTIVIDRKFEYSLVRNISTPKGQLLTFALWQRNGVTQETSMLLSSFEKIGFGDPTVPFVHGRYPLPGYGGERYELWADNGGFGY